MGQGFQFFDIILFALIAAFLVLRLRSVLGRRDGHEGGFPDPFKPSDQVPAAEADDKIVHLPGRGKETADDLFGPKDRPAAEAPMGSIAAGVEQIRKADPGFELDGFLSGARAAFEMILGAFTSGDTAALKPLLSPDVHGNFVEAIRQREQAGERCEDQLIGIKKVEAVEAYLQGRNATVTIKFVSDQVRATRNDKGDVVDGDPNVIIEVTDFWTFARDTRSRDPNWTLVATDSPE